MILHLGSDCFVTTGSILMILDYEEAVNNRDTSLFLKAFSKVSVESSAEPKSIVITEDMGVRRMYLSPISHKTLLKRSRSNGCMGLV